MADSKNKRLFVKYSEIIFTVICVGTFGYQALTLFLSYNQGKTVVHVEIGHILDDNNPAITICPAGIDLSKLAARSDKYMMIYHDYLTLLNKSNLDLKFIMSTYKNIQNDIIGGKISFDDLFRKYTYTFDSERGNIEASINQIIVEDDIMNDENIFVKNPVNYILTRKPIESLVSNQFFIRKCFTYFSHLDPIWKNSSLKFEEFRMKFNYDKNKYPAHMYSIMLQLHSANDMPLMVIGSTR